MTHELRLGVHVDLEAVADGHAYVMRTEAGGHISPPERVSPPLSAEALVAAGLRLQIGAFDV